MFVNRPGPGLGICGMRCLVTGASLVLLLASPALGDQGSLERGFTAPIAPISKRPAVAVSPTWRASAGKFFYQSHLLPEVHSQLKKAGLIDIALLLLAQPQAEQIQSFYIFCPGFAVRAFLDVG